jgi:hypothetical protein
MAPADPDEPLTREAAIKEIKALRRIAAEALRGMTDDELLDLRDRLERGETDDRGRASG